MFFDDMTRVIWLIHTEKLGRLRLLTLAASSSDALLRPDTLHNLNLDCARNNTVNPNTIAGACGLAVTHCTVGFGVDPQLVAELGANLGACPLFFCRLPIELGD